MVTRLRYGDSVPQCEVAQGSRGKPFPQLIVGAGGEPSLPISGPPPTPTPPLWRSWRTPRLDSGTNFPEERGLGAGEVRPGSVR